MCEPSWQARAQTRHTHVCGGGVSVSCLRLYAGMHGWPESNTRLPAPMLRTSHSAANSGGLSPPTRAADRHGSLIQLRCSSLVTKIPTSIPPMCRQPPCQRSPPRLYRPNRHSILENKHSKIYQCIKYNTELLAMNCR